MSIIFLFWSIKQAHVQAANVSSDEMPTAHENLNSVENTTMEIDSEETNEEIDASLVLGSDEGQYTILQILDS